MATKYYNIYLLLEYYMETHAQVQHVTSNTKIKVWKQTTKSNGMAE